MIKSRGAPMSPKEIEKYLCRLDGVIEPAAIGVRDETQGESILVYVRLQEGASLSERHLIT